MKRFTLICMMMAVTCVGATAQSVTKLTATKANDYGLIYTLPTTVVDVTIEAECTELTPGSFSLYATKYLRTTPILEHSKQWELKSVTLTTRGVNDDSERYSVTFKAGSPVTMLLAPNNAPLSINDEGYSIEEEKVTLPQAKDMSASILDSPVALQAMTEEMIQSTSTAKRAELAANKIYELRQSRNDLITGNAESMPKDGASLKLALDNLTAQEEALSAMFNGVSTTGTEVATFSFTPGEDSGRTIIARLSTLDGIVPADDLSGAPIYINYEVLSKGELPLTEKGEPRKFPKGGIAYRIPGSGSVSISFDGKTYASLTLDVAQLGVVYGMDPGVFSDKKAPSYVHFNSKTGAIKETGAVK